MFKKYKIIFYTFRYFYFYLQHLGTARYVLLDYFTTRPSFNVFEVTIGAKNVLTFEKRPLVAGLKLKMSQMEHFLCFQCQLCHQWVILKCLYIFSIYDHLVKKATFGFLKDGLLGVCCLVILAPCIATFVVYLTAAYPGRLIDHHLPRLFGAQYMQCNWWMCHQQH